MKTIYLLLLILLFPAITIAQQNLVRNPGFESFNLCPENTVQNYIELANDWYSYRATPDYFNECVPDSAGTLWDVPHNGWGFQEAHSGQAYAGFYTYGNPNGGSENYREWIGSQLINALTPGVRYFISFYYVRASSGFYYSSNWSTNKIGVLFTTNPNYTDYALDPLPNFSQVYTDSILTDTINWTKYSVSYVPDSAYQFITIGNMFDAANTDTILLGQVSLGAFYYLDDVCISTDSLLCNSISGLNSNSYQSKVNVYPIPATKSITIDLNNNIFTKLLLFDITSKIMIDTDISKNSKISLDISNFKSGIYLLELSETITHAFYRKKIVIINN